MGDNAQTSVPKFTSGDVLTAANTNLLSNGIPVFSGTATRDDSFGGSGEKVLAEGQFSFIEAAPKRFQVYNGTNWIDYDTTQTTYTPALTNLTLGNGSTSGTYYRIGKYIVGSFYLGFGSTTSVSGTIGIGLPFTVASGTNNRVLANLAYGDTGVTTYQGWGLIVEDATKIDCYVNNVSGTFGSVGQPTSSTVPMTWSNTDEIYGQFFYRAA
jgi:hypothetical protein